MTSEIHVFACYHRADAQIVEAFRVALGERGVIVFHDTSDIGAGAPWRSRIEAALRTCDALLLFYGTHNLGPTQAGEVELAKIFRKPIIPIVLHGAAEPSAETGLHQRHWLRITPSTQCPDVGDVTRIVDACRQAPSNLWRDPPFLTPAGEPVIDSRRRLPRNPEKVRKLRQSLAGVGRFLRYACPSTIGAAACMLLTWLPAAEGWTSPSTLAAIATLSLSALWAFYEATPALSEWEDIILRNRLAIPQGEDAEPAKIAVVASTEQGIWALPYFDGLSALLDNVESITLGDKPIAGVDAETLASAQAVVLVWASQQNGYIAGRRVPAVQAALDWAAEHPERPFLLVGPEHAVRPSHGGWEPRIRRDDPAAAARETLATLLGRSVSRSEGWHTRARRLWALWAWTCGIASLLVVVLAKSAVEAHSASHSIGDSAKAVGASVTATPVPLYGASEGIKAVLRQVADVQSETLQRNHALFRRPRVSVWGRVSLPSGDCICEIVGPTVEGGGTACFDAQRLANVSVPQGAAFTFKSVSECAERGYLATYRGGGDPDQVAPDAQAEVYDLDGERHDVPACRVGVPHLTPPWMLCVPVAPMDQTNVSALAPRSSSAGAVCVTDDSTWGPSLRDRTLQQTVLGHAQAFASFPLAQLATEEYWDMCSAEIEAANGSGTASPPPRECPAT